jgi:hypothetical protein
MKLRPRRKENLDLGLCQLWIDELIVIGQVEITQVLELDIGESRDVMGECEVPERC